MADDGFKITPTEQADGQGQLIWPKGNGRVGQALTAEKGE